MEFTLRKYKKLLLAFLEKEYKLKTVNTFQEKEIKTVLLRHDVDRYPKIALRMAILEAELGVKATYFFRILPSVFKEDIITKIQELGHEVSYHYEDLSLMKGNFEKAIQHFEFQLNKFRKIAPTQTICMHGSPLSKWDNKQIWKKYNYKKFGIICDTSFDINYDEVFYITDNGWGWNKNSTSIRDKVVTKFNIHIKDTDHLINLIYSDKLPSSIMLNAHPDTFNDNFFLWFVNFCVIKGKNIAKRIIVKYNIIK